MNDATVLDTNESNFGRNYRFIRTMKSKTWCLEGPLSIDIFNQDRLMLNGVNVSLKFIPQQDTFRLMCGKKTTTVVGECQCVIIMK
jgi:hypothetical protein